MSLSHRVRARARRSTLLALAATGASAALLGASASPAAAYPAGSFEINNFSHYASKTQEEGAFGARSDEFYLLSVNFQFQPGKASSLKVWRNSWYEIDNIDQGERHGIDARMGQAKFDLPNGWSPADIFTQNVGPWMMGSVSVAFESDLSPSGSINEVHRAAEAAIRAKLADYIGHAGPQQLLFNAGVQTVADFLWPGNKALREQIMKDWALGVATDGAIVAIKQLNIWKGIGALLDDVIGGPHFSLILGVGNESLLGVPLPFGTLLDGGLSSAGLKSASGDQLLALPGTGGHNYTQTYSGDGARYVLSVRARKLP